jgi:tripeptidyl-peptidase-1
VSYGNDERQQSGTAYMESVNTAFMKAGSLGLSILFASGDQGVCGREGCGFFRKRFKPDFPGGSPYHTSVGGTNFATDQIGDEEVWDNGGGGFSDTFPIPAYQADAVSSFKSASEAAGTLPPSNLYNNSGRGYPDVAALGGQKAPYCVAVGGRFTAVAGTSASCPVVAGLFARLNAKRLQV